MAFTYENQPYSQDDVNVNYFADGRREIDFILVCDDTSLSSSQSRTHITTFLQNLEKNGLQFEIEVGKVFEYLIFIKVHGPYNVLLRYANAFKIRLAFRSLKHRIHPKIACDWLATELTNTDPDSPIFTRARTFISGLQIAKYRFMKNMYLLPVAASHLNNAFRETMSNERPTKITVTERIMIVHALLCRGSFGNSDVEYGLTKLLNNRTFVAAYPLHGGKWEWTQKGPLGDRQLLAKYWARLGLWYKQQPLNLVEKYYGPEVAFYFAFCGFYRKMLIPACLMGILTFCFGFVGDFSINRNPIEETCNSDLPLCPAFFSSPDVEYRHLNDLCLHSKMTFVFDNTATIVFAFIMAFWATIFMELWKREHTVLMYRWRLKNKGEDPSWRPEFAENTNYRRICPITGDFEPYIPKWILLLNYSLTCVACASMIIIVIFAVFLTIISRLFMNFSNLLSLVQGAIMSVLFIKVFGRIYAKIAFWLTTRENPRTQTEFDDSYVYKLFLLSFFNNYSALMYVAFFKGYFYSYPGAKRWDSFLNFLESDLCHPGGCIMGLCITLVFIMILKSTTGNVCTLFLPSIKKLWRKYIYQEEPLPPTTSPWELDYTLQEMGHYFLVGEYMEMVMQYGLVTFFVAAFPLAPLCALIGTLIELRMDANKFVKYCRRPVPVQIHGLEGWNGILQAMTFMSMVANAFVIAFTSDYVKREIYKYNHDPFLKGYINSTLSKFSTKDLNMNTTDSQSVCYYRANRYPPDHPHKYQLTSEFWYELCMRFVVAVIFEHIILTLTGILGYAIPDIPYSTKKQINRQRHKIKQERIKEVDDLHHEWGSNTAAR